MFNVWSVVQPGPARDQRIGDKISPVGMSLTMMLEAKFDRPNTMFRVIVARLPKIYNGVVTGNIFDPFQSTGTLNRMILAADNDIGVRFLYDRIHRFGPQQQPFLHNGSGRQLTKVVKLWIKRRKGARPIVYNQNLQQIVNNPIAVYVIPYEEWNTLETDNIAQVDYRCRLYWKDV